MHLRGSAFVTGCIMMGILMAACGSEGASGASSAPTGQIAMPSTPQAEQMTATPPLPSAIPSPDSTASMVSQPLPDKGWPKGYFGAYTATWSPARAELMLDGCELGDDGLYLASAPDFTPTLLVRGTDRENHRSDGKRHCNGAGWSPSGEHIVYLAVEPQYSIGVISRYGTHARTVEGDFQKFSYEVHLDHLHWYSQQTLMLNVFQGVDAYSLNYLIDISTGGARKIGDGQALLRESSPTLDYIALDTWLMNVWHYAAAISLIEETDYWDERNSTGYDSVGALNLHYWRSNGIVQDSFMDWLPDSNQMLILATNVDDKGQRLDSALILWNVDQDTYVTLAPGGIHGAFSADASLLAYVKPNDEEAFNLQILDMQSLLMTHVYPLRAYSVGGVLRTAQMAFSPDGRYLAFISPATAETGTETLNLFDLHTKEIVHTVPIAEKSEDSFQIPLWSPDGHALAFYNSDVKLSILDVGTCAQVRVEDIVSKDIVAPDDLEWSYDGRYVSVRDGNRDLWVIEVP